jgi:hypothetical protein
MLESAGFVARALIEHWIPRAAGSVLGSAISRQSGVLALDSAPRLLPVSQRTS